VNIGALQRAVDAGKLDAGKPVDIAALQAAGLLNQPRDGVRLLGKGELKAKLDLHVAGVTKSALAAVEKAGGTVTLPAKKAEAAA
jgi:large subunit ribosomal protein L15